MSTVLHHPDASRLRLVVPADGPTTEEVRARRAIRQENERAARMAYEGGEDVRRILAMRTAEVLEGGRAAILAPQRRRELVRQGERFGMRPFEANLVIAVVQDAARLGETVEDEAVARSLQVIPEPPSESPWEDRWTWARLWLASAALAGLVLMFLVDWIMGATGVGG